MEAALRTRVMGAVTVAGSRVYWTLRPQNSALPAIVLSVVSDVRTQNMDGFDGYQSKRVQIDCYATTYAEAASMREAVIAGVVPADDAGGVNFLRSFVNNTMSRGEDTAAGFVHRQMIDLTVWHD